MMADIYDLVADFRDRQSRSQGSLGVLARDVVRQWREANDWPGLVWSPHELSDERRWTAAWADLEKRIAEAVESYGALHREGTEGKLD